MVHRGDCKIHSGISKENSKKRSRNHLISESILISRLAYKKRIELV